MAAFPPQTNTFCPPTCHFNHKSVQPLALTFHHLCLPPQHLSPPRMFSHCVDSPYGSLLCAQWRSMWPTGAFGLPLAASLSGDARPRTCLSLCVRAAIISPQRCQTTDPCILLFPHRPPPRPPFRFPVVRTLAHTAATIREALDWWAKPPLNDLPRGEGGRVRREQRGGGGGGELQMCLYTVIPFPQRDCRWNEGQGGRKRDRKRQKLHTEEPQLGCNFFDALTSKHF